MIDLASVRALGRELTDAAISRITTAACPCDQHTPTGDQPTADQLAARRRHTTEALTEAMRRHPSASTR